MPSLPTDAQRSAALNQAWDIVIVGGGITGAGILLEASRCGLKALLVEQRDFAWGTSSRSSKLVHGGLRYLKEGQLGLTLDSVRERQHLMQQARGLVDPQAFAFADYQGRKPGRWLFQIGLMVYDLMAGVRGKLGRHYHRADEFLLLAPHIGRVGLKGGMSYVDAKTDDARLVLRVLQEARSLGGVAINYMQAKQLLRAGAGTTASQTTASQVSGVELQDAVTGTNHAVNAKVVISATGAWADGLRKQLKTPPRLSLRVLRCPPKWLSCLGAARRQLDQTAKIRPLRGSHLVLPAWRLPVAQAVSLMHPQDGRPVFAFPWEGATLVGTTDIDHHTDLQQEPSITPAEVDYLMAALIWQFPQLNLCSEDVIATYAGVRPVIDSGKADPSKESRDHAVWMDQGLLTVTGGKLTTFRLIALDALKHVVPLFAHAKKHPTDAPVFSPSSAPPPQPGMTTQQLQRLHGHYGAQAKAVVAAALEGELQTINGTETLWVELRWAARHEAVVHLQDLMLRRTRLGLLLRSGGIGVLPRVRAICQTELGWSDARWDSEQADYLALWQAHYSPPHTRTSTSTSESTRTTS